LFLQLKLLLADIKAHGSNDRKLFVGWIDNILIMLNWEICYGGEVGVWGVGASFPETPKA
jgi:hypothetical protein